MFLLFLAPFSWGNRKARGLCSQGEWVLYGRDLCRSGGTGKAEAAKLPGAGIGPSSAQENARQKKASYRTQHIGSGRSELACATSQCEA
jgi:hypothetical protein